MPVILRQSLIGLLLLVLAALPACRQSAPTTSPATAPELTPPEPADMDAFESLPDVVTLDNGQLAVGISPAVGRIVSLIPAGGDNLLWRATRRQIAADRARRQWHYFNWGGDKVWPALQLSWERMFSQNGPWPPPPIIDGDPWKVVEQTPLALTLESGINTQLNVQVRRRIELDADRPHLVIANTITRIKPSPYPVMIWSITQVKTPQSTFLAIADDRPDPATPWIVMSPQSTFDPAWVTPLDAAIAVRPDFAGVPEAKSSMKVGAFGRFIAAAWDKHLLVERVNFEPRGSYPDGSNIQVYSDLIYTEIETLSPQVHLQPGESLTNTIHWFVLPRPAGDDPALLSAITAPAPAPGSVPSPTPAPVPPPAR